MSNVLEAFVSLKQTNEFLVEKGLSGNAIQQIGSGLETFVKDLFSNIVGAQLTQPQKLEKYQEYFAYTGSANHPPDSILKGGDVIEVKKVDSLRGSVQLNSSPPKQKFTATDPRITQRCRDEIAKEGWHERDNLYVIGSLPEGKLRRLWMIYGDCFAANHEVYDRVAESVKGAIVANLNGAHSETTKELGGVPDVDPLKLTYLRVRGMWIIKNPSVVFQDYIQSSNNNFQAYCLLKESKYTSFSQKTRAKFESEIGNGLAMQKIKIPDPDNPVSLMKVRLLSYEI